MDAVVVSLGELRVGGPVVEEVVLQVADGAVALGLVVFADGGEVDAVRLLDVLVAGLHDAGVGHLEGDLLAHFHDGVVGDDVLGAVEQFLVGGVPFLLDGSVGHQGLELGEHGVAHHAAELDVLRLPDGGAQVLPGKVVGDAGDGLHEGLAGE